MDVTKLQSPFLKFNFFAFLRAEKKTKKGIFSDFLRMRGQISPKIKKGLCNFVKTIAKNLYANF